MIVCLAVFVCYMLHRCFVELEVTYHDRAYRNPHNRRCAVCGRHDVEYSNDHIYWWETYDEGELSKHKEALVE